MRILVGLVLAALGAWLVVRRRGADGQRVIVAWADGSELELGTGSEERERLLALARGALP